MELLKTFIDIFLHLDKHLGGVIQTYGIWTYLILFLIIFCETGLVVTPVLPGDSLLFAAGAFAALGALDVRVLFLLLTVAAIAGDTLNYWIGHMMGPKIFRKEKVRFLNREYLDRTHQFYEKHGGKTIIIARFMPIIRTFAPFVAGIGRMTYMKFIGYNVAGGIIWISSFVFAGYYFGNIPVVKRNFTLVIVAIIFFSILPGIIEFFRHRYQNKSHKVGKNNMGILGVIFIAIGIIGLYVSLTMRTSISTEIAGNFIDVINIGLLNDKQNYIIISIFILSVGVLLLALSFLRRSLKGTAEVAKGDISDNTLKSFESKVCPTCAETVQAKAIKCRFCGHLF